MKATMKLGRVIAALMQIFFRHLLLPLCSVHRAPICLMPGVTFSPGFSESATTCTSHLLRSARYENRRKKEERKKKRERERENAISRPAGAWKIASFYKDTQIPSGRFVILVRWHGTAYGLEEIGYAVVAIVVALACRCSFIMVTSLIS